jgi:hypothetical protein
LQGNILSQSGTKTGQIRPNARNRFVVAVNTALSTYCIYLNGVKISDWAKIANMEIKDFYEMKLMAQSSSDAKIFIDKSATDSFDKELEQKAYDVLKGLHIEII